MLAFWAGGALSVASTVVPVVPRRRLGGHPRPDSRHHIPEKKVLSGKPRVVESYDDTDDILLIMSIV